MAELSLSSNSIIVDGSSSMDYILENTQQSTSKDSNSIAWNSSEKSLEAYRGNIYLNKGYDIGSTNNPDRAIWSQNYDGVERLFVADGGRKYHLTPGFRVGEIKKEGVGTDPGSFGSGSVNVSFSSSIQNLQGNQRVRFTGLSLTTELVDGTRIDNISAVLRKNGTTITSINVPDNDGGFSQKFFPITSRYDNFFFSGVDLDSYDARITFSIFDDGFFSSGGSANYQLNVFYILLPTSYPSDPSYSQLIK